MSIPQITGWRRLAIALSIVLAGMALLPYIALPSEHFDWEDFSRVYSDGPILVINYDTGAPGSSFTISGFNYPANQQVTIKANGHVLGTATTNKDGSFVIQITSSIDSEEGYYEIKAEVNSEGDAADRLSLIATASVRFQLRAAAPLRTAEGTAPSFALPQGIATELFFLPFVVR